MSSKIKVQAALLALLTLTFGAMPIQAQEEERRFENVETSRVRATSQATARMLEPARNFLSPQPEVEGGPVPEPNPQAALAELANVRLDRLPGHEKAEVYNLFGFSYYLLDNTEQAKRYFQLIIDEPGANAPMVVQTIKTLAGLYAGDQQWQQALDLYLEWMSYQEIVGASDYAYVGIIYFNLEDAENALKYLELAIAKREEVGEIGEESWYSIQRIIYYNRNDFRQAIEIYKKLVVYYPKASYWREMGSMFAELEQSDEQMASYDLAWLQDGLTSEGQVLGLSGMYSGRGAPLQAAEVIIKGMEDGLVEENDTNFQRVGYAYLQARDMDQAMLWMERAAAEAEDGAAYAWLANIYNSVDRYEEGYRSAMEALDRGGLDQPDQVRLQAGVALLYMYRYDEALAQFRRIRDERTIEYARNMIRFTESEATRERQLRNSGIDIDAIRRETRGG